VESAVAQGATRLDAFAVPHFAGDTEGFLPRLYRTKGGFIEVARVEIDLKYDPPAGAMWVSIMARLDTPPDEVKRFAADKYEQALEYRDSLFQNSREGR
jgi:hypothetical protein